MIQLILKDEFDNFERKCRISPSVSDPNLIFMEVNIGPDFDLDDVFFNEKYISEALEYEIRSTEKCIDDVDDEYAKFQVKYLYNLQKYYDDIQSFIKDIDVIIPRFFHTDLNKYINDNPIVRSHKIWLVDIHVGIDDIVKIKSLMEDYKGLEDKISIHFYGDDKPTTLNEALKIVEGIENTIDHIKKLDLSPFEQTMYVYDMVRNREYKREAGNEEKNTSRDLASVYSGDKIVCLGFANLYNTYLNGLGIKCRVNDMYYDNDIDKPGHARCVAYIEDPKYNIYGVFYFDPTFDCKSNTPDLSSYKYFAKTKSEMDSYIKSNLVDHDIEYYNDDFYNEVKTAIKNGTFMQDMIQTTKFKTINAMSKMVLGRYILPLDRYFCSGNKRELEQEILEELEELTDLYKCHIPAEKYLDALIHVRKMEYYENNQEYVFDLSFLYKAFKKSKWKFKHNELNAEGKLLKAIFGEVNEDMIDDRESFKKYFLDNHTGYEIEQTKLTKVLSLYSKSKNN